ncbi:unnamed protein product [Rotaria sordida]|uniref:Uncharacterized protein n=1 Tax=Rotaria sordida TaxID=392033 RepID=A0A818KTX0_9BILA|nr:unnamed protein product [Rotaria sordida]
MKVSQWSDWPSEPWQNLQQQSSVSDQSIQPNNDTWSKENDDKRKTNQTKGSALRSLLYGILLGSLLTGIALAAVLTLWLTSTQSTISPNSTITTTIITLITTTITTMQGTTLTESTLTSTTITTVSTTVITTIRITPSNLLVNPGAEYDTLVL